MSGGNKPNFHKVFYNFSFDKKFFTIADIRNAKEGDKIHIDSDEILKEKRELR